MEWKQIINFELWGNTGEQYAIAIGSFVGLTILFKIFQMVVLRRLKKLSKRTDTDLDDFIIDLVRHVKPPFYFMVAFYLATKMIFVNEFMTKVIFGMFVIIVVFQAIVTAQKIIDYVVRKKILDPDDEEDDKNKEAIVKLAGQLVKVALWMFGGLLVLSNLGVDVTSLVAGLGIGGIAIALAVKDILGDLFASFSIFIDKPFKVGDFISLSKAEQGTVEKIGIKTTRLRTRKGQQLIVANKALTEATIGNFRRMEKRQTTFSVGVTYDTKAEVLKKIPVMITEVIEKIEHASVVRVNLDELGDFSINFKVVFEMSVPDFDLTAKAKEKIQLEIIEAFEKERIELAFPTQTIHLEK